MFQCSCHGRIQGMGMTISGNSSPSTVAAKPIKYRNRIEDGVYVPYTLPIPLIRSKLDRGREKIITDRFFQDTSNARLWQMFTHLGRARGMPRSRTWSGARACRAPSRGPATHQATALAHLQQPSLCLRSGLIQSHNLQIRIRSRIQI